MEQSPAILVFGHDITLLETRRLVLQRAGFQPWTVTTIEDAEKILTVHPGCLLVLCHSLVPQDRDRILSVSHKRRPKLKNLVLTAGTPVGSLAKRDEVFSSFDGPSALIDLVAWMMKCNLRQM